MAETLHVQIIAVLFEQHRRAQGLTYRALAQQVGVAHLAVWRLCHGRTPNPGFWLVTRLMAVLKITGTEWETVLTACQLSLPFGGHP